MNAGRPHAREALDCRLVMIIDWDAHHGNGTQEIFWVATDVLFIDIHCASPFYPGSGLLDEVGAGRGDGAYLQAFRDILIPAVD